VTLNLHFKVTV